MKKFVVDIEEYGRQQTIINLLTELNEAEEVIKMGDEWLTLNDLKNKIYSINSAYFTR